MRPNAPEYARRMAVAIINSHLRGEDVEASTKHGWNVLLGKGDVRIEPFVGLGGQQEYPLCLVLPIPEVAS